MDLIKNNLKQILKLPTTYSEELAEETGIHIGDGGMGFHISKGKHNWHYTYCCHNIDDKEYCKYVKRLIKKLYNLDPINDKKRNSNTKILRYTRKNLVLYKMELGLPLGPKDNIRIPEWIFKNKKFKIACIRGIFDTDGSVMLQKKYKKIPYYPHLKITSKSKAMILQIQEIFDEFGIKSSLSMNKRTLPRSPNDIWNVEIYGSSNFNKYVKKIGFSNPKHLKKDIIWKKIYAGAETFKKLCF